MKRIITAFALALLSITTSYAVEPRTVGAYIDHMKVDKQQKPDLDHTLHHMLYLTGVSEGYEVVNKQQRADKQKRLFCQPETEMLNGTDYMRILERSLNRPDKPVPDHLSVAEAMLLALKEEFPCK
jgi:hypothetical protein